MELLMLGLIAGAVVPFQTAVNSRLRTYVISPFISSLISFLVGTTFLIVVTLISGGHILLSANQIAVIPWWMYLGGVLGMIGLTTNILLFPILGSVQTVIMPVLGQIIMSMVIDNYGMFGTTLHPLSLMRIVGVVLLIVGVLVVVALPGYLVKDPFEDSKQHQVRFKWLWQLFGVVVGGMLAIQAALNGRLGGLLHAPIHAALISFLIGTLMLFIVALCQGTLKNIRLVTRQKTPWWVWIGGFFGAAYIFLNSYLVPEIGTGTVVVLVLLGQIISSLNIDQFGLLGSMKSSITVAKVVGLVVMIVGVGLIEVM
jgi:transporter family-2 protein